jgi:ATP-dependent DNA helicase PIF1
MTQAEALSILKTGANVFLTGEPGAGKSHTVNAYVQYLRNHGVEPAITASTGIAATHIHGLTIHSWSGIGIRKFLSPYDLEHMTTIEYLAKRIRNTHVLIIDEISMIDAQTLDMVDAVCRAIRQNLEPFGGMQVVLVGDFFQLPPVSNDRAPSFAFTAKVWEQMVPIICYLTEQHRQHDEVFLSILSAIRNNNYDSYHHEHLETRMIESIDHAPQVTRLYPKNMSVDQINSMELKKLSGKSQTYHMKSKGSAALIASLMKGCLSPEVLELKVGAIVMCTKNNPAQKYANGTLGTVIDFAKDTRYPIIETKSGQRILIEPADWVIEEEGKIKASIMQLPLRLAWAITIHKSQGMSLDAALMDLQEVFEYGQGYVALSRVRALEGLYLLGYNRETFMVHPTILEQDSAFKAKSESARASFTKIPDEELKKMHTNFLTAIGGNIEGGKAKKKGKVDTLEETKLLVLKKEPLKTIASIRKVTVATILGHIEKLIAEQRITGDDVKYLLDHHTNKNLKEIESTFKKLKTNLLTPVYEKLKGKYSYDQLKIVRMTLEN